MPATFIQQMQDLDIDKVSIPNFISEATDNIAREYAEYFLKEISEDERLNYRYRVSVRDVHEIVNVFSSFRAFSNMVAMEALRNSVSFNEFWSGYLNRLKNFEVKNKILNEHFHATTFKLSNDILEVVSCPSDILEFWHAKPKDVNSDYVLESIAFERMYSEKEGEEIEMSEYEKQAIIVLLDAYEEEDDEEKTLEVTAKKINRDWHAGLNIRTVDDIRMILSELDEEEELVEVSEEGHKQDVTTEAIVKEAGKEPTSDKEAPKITEVEDRETRMPIIPPEEKEQVIIAHKAEHQEGEIRDKIEGMEGIKLETLEAEIAIMRGQLEKVQLDHQRMADLHRICGHLLALQVNLVDEAFKFHKMRNPDADRIDKISDEINNVQLIFEDTYEELKDIPEQLANSKTMIHKIAGSVVDGSRGISNPSDIDRLKDFLEVLNDFDTKIAELKKLMENLNKIRGDVEEVRTDVNQGNAFVRRRLKEQLPGVDPSNLFLTEHKYLLDENTETPAKLDDILSSINRCETLLIKLEEGRLNSRIDPFKEKAIDALRMLGVVKPQPARVTQAPAPRVEIPSPRTEVSAPKTRELTVDSAQISDINIEILSVTKNQDQQFEEIEFTFNGEKMKVRTPTLRALRILEELGNFNVSYLYMGRAPIILAKMLTEVFDEFNIYNDSEQIKTQLCPIIEEDLLNMSGKVDFVGKMSREARESVVRPVIQMGRQIRGEIVPTFTSSVTTKTFLKEIPIETELSDVEKKRIFEANEMRKNKYRLEKTKQWNRGK